MVKEELQSFLRGMFINYSIHIAKVFPIIIGKDIFYLYETSLSMINLSLRRREGMLTTILIISVIIVLIVLFLAVITTSKAYSYKHTVDPISTNEEHNHDKKDSQD